MSATGAPRASRALASLGSRFDPTICDQLIDQAAIRCHIGKKPTHPLGRCAAAFDLRLRELDDMIHMGKWYRPFRLTPLFLGLPMSD